MSTNLISRINNREEVSKINLIVDKSNVFIKTGSTEVVDTKRAINLGIINEKDLNNVWGGKTDILLSIEDGLIINQSGINKGEECVRSVLSSVRNNSDFYSVIIDGNQLEINSIKDFKITVINKCNDISSDKTTIQFIKKPLL